MHLVFIPNRTKYTSNVGTKNCTNCSHFVLDIAAWAQEHFHSKNTICCVIHNCWLKLYHANNKPRVTTIQEMQPSLGQRSRKIDKQIYPYF